MTNCTNPRFKKLHKSSKLHLVVRATRVNIFSKAAMLLIATLTPAERVEMFQLCIQPQHWNRAKTKQENDSSDKSGQNILPKDDFMIKVDQRRIAIK